MSEIQAGLLRDSDDQVVVVKPDLHDGHAEVAFLGDQHIANRYYSEKSFNRYVSFIKERPWMRVVGMGDYLENASASRNPYMIRDEVADPDIQADIFGECWRPMENQVDVLLSGNHELRTKRAAGLDVLTSTLLYRLNRRDMHVAKPERGAYIVYQVGDNDYVFWVHHGSMSSRKPAYQIEMAEKVWMSDAIVLGHIHRLLIETGHIFGVIRSKGKKFSRGIFRRYRIRTGSFLKYPPYAESKFYPITDVGAPIVRLSSEKPRMEWYVPEPR